MTSTNSEADRDADYPPAPWHMLGDMWLALWWVPLASLLGRIPEEVRPMHAGGRVPLGTAWVDYHSGGTMSYRELLAAVPVRDGRRTGVTITDIWVDSHASMRGGRELWGIPKRVAQFELGESTPGTRTFHLVTADTESDPNPEPSAAVGEIACRARGGTRVPGTWGSAWTTVQRRGDGLRVTPVRVRSNIRLARTSWRIDPNGPLGFLAGRRPWFSVLLEDFRLSFDE